MSLLETKKKWLNIWEEWERVTLLIIIFIKLGKVKWKICFRTNMGERRRK